MNAPLLPPGVTVASSESIALAVCKDGCGALHTTEGVETWQLESEAMHLAKAHAGATGHTTQVDVECTFHFFPHSTRVSSQAGAS